jgi:hypothetical protein
LAAIENVTPAEPATDAGEVMVNQLTFAAALQTHVAPAETVSEPVDAPAATDTDRADSDGAQGVEAAKTLEAVLGDDPPGPTAVTRA